MEVLGVASESLPQGSHCIFGTAEKRKKQEWRERCWAIREGYSPASIQKYIQTLYTMLGPLSCDHSKINSQDQTEIFGATLHRTNIRLPRDYTGISLTKPCDNTGIDNTRISLTMWKKFFSWDCLSLLSPLGTTLESL